MGTTRSYRAIAAVSTLTVLAACASMPAPVDDSRLYGIETSRAILTAEQLLSVNVGTMPDALRRLRPQLFTHRALFATNDPYQGYAVLYVDGRLQGGLDLLNTIPLHAVRSVQFMSGSEGHAYFGRYHPGGVVEVNTRR